MAELPDWVLEVIVLEPVSGGMFPRGLSGEIPGLGFHERKPLFAYWGLAYSYMGEDLAAERKDPERSLPFQ